MHNALLISELLGHISYYLAEDSRWYPGRKTIYSPDPRTSGLRALAQLARTCRTFSEPALDALWRRLHSLEPFLLCWGCKSYYHYNDITAVNGNFPPCSDKGWNVVLRYAPRIQELMLEDRISVKILLSLCSRTTQLLPNLRKLRWFHQDLAAIGCIRLLLGPSLRYFFIWLSGGRHGSALQFLESFPSLCPNLKTLHFSHYSSLPCVVAVVSRTVVQTQSLEILSCQTVDEAALIHIAGLRRLASFSAWLLDYQPNHLRRLASYGTLDRPPFENLRILDIHVEDLSSITPFLRSHCQPFEDVTIEFRMFPAPWVYHEFFTALSSATRQRTLRHLRLFSLGFGGDQEPVQLVDFQVLQPLTTFNLCSFSVNINNWISLNDDELVLLVRGWHKLETFYFNQQNGWGSPPTCQIPTLRGLLRLVDRCPQLRHVGMCVDARYIPTLSEEEASIRNTDFTRLWLTNSPIEMPATVVARFLLEHFPSVVTLLLWNHPNFNRRLSHDERETWGEVNRLIQEAR